ncbi:asparaginase [Microbacterium schleiferi]|uniref:Asparaginase n=1 Tax=Microbacterium schleiferi TaxID=69362 RepID=A0A7S8RIF3_9MICO|nr:asparaginase [Microbacterium schleiferi]QPE05342.1 asparaginase [Microbacterium schleiferi]
MSETLPVAAAVELARVERGGFVESRHAGAAIVLDADGQVVEQFGDADAPILPRSSLKPIQALACLAAGAPLAGETLALATASHAGTDRHVAVVRDVLDAAGLDERSLQCPPAWPSDTATRDALVRAGGEPERLRMNCSGKHAAMLAACVAQGWDIATYLDAEHPLQVQIRELVERLTGERVQASVVDGCGAPVFAVTLAGLAKAAHRIGGSSERSPFALHRNAAALVAAVRAHPWTIDGPGRPDTIAIQETGVFAKGGAEGVMIMVAPDGTTAALKMLDGSARASTIVSLRLLERAGALSPADVSRAREALPLRVRGGERDVGVISPAF